MYEDGFASWSRSKKSGIFSPEEGSACSPDSTKKISLFGQKYQLPSLWKILHKMKVASTMLKTWWPSCARRISQKRCKILWKLPASSLKHGQSETQWKWNTVKVKQCDWRHSVSESFRFCIEYQSNNQSRGQTPNLEFRGRSFSIRKSISGCKKKSINQPIKWAAAEIKIKIRFILIPTWPTCKASSVGRVSGLHARWKTCFRSSTFSFGYQKYLRIQLSRDPKMLKEYS